MIRNKELQSIGAELINASTGAAFTGGVLVYVTVDGGTQALGATGAGVCTAEGHGYYTYTPTAQETNGDLCAFTFVGTGAVPATIQIATVTPSQQSALATATGGTSTPIDTILRDAFREIAVFAPTDSIPPDDMSFALGKLNRLFDNMTDDRRVVFANQFVTYPLIPNHTPHTIGPNSADFTVTTRPVSIELAQFVLTSVTPNLYLPIHLRDDAWWASVPIRGVTSSICTDLYYSPDWPNGTLNLWPVPSVAGSLELVTRTVFALVSVTDTFWLPPGYRDWVTLKLAEALVSGYPGSTVAPTLGKAIADGESRLLTSNVRAPSLATADYGTGGGRGGSFNYKDRQWH